MSANNSTLEKLGHNNLPLNPHRWVLRNQRPISWINHKTSLSTSVKTTILILSTFFTTGSMRPALQVTSVTQRAHRWFGLFLWSLGLQLPCGAAGFEDGTRRKPPHLAHQADRPSSSGSGPDQWVTHCLGHCGGPWGAVWSQLSQSWVGLSVQGPVHQDSLLQWNLLLLEICLWRWGR